MPDKERKTAHAPYNFVPLPDRVVAAESIPDHDQYHADRRTGYFGVKLTTETPLYIRGMLTEKEAANKEQHKDKPDFFQLGGKPIIPGSSLRGMIRNLVEIITFGKMTRVSDKPKIFFRSVAAKSDDPLGEHYKQVTGQLGKNVRAGYLIRKGEEWFIRPASQYAGSYFVKVKDDNSRVNGVNGLIHLSDANYKVQYHNVMYLEARGSKGNYIASVRSPKQGEKRQGVLVCTGNMAESATPDRRGRVKTGRKNFVLVLEADERAKPIQIAPQAVKDYLDGLTSFQTEAPFDRQYGCLIEGRPVFYIPPLHDGMVYYFGHAPFSRIPAMIIDEDGKKRAVTPHDFIPAEVRDNPDHYDIAEAIFGYVEKGDKKAPRGDKTRAHASRVSVTDARPADGQSDFYEAEFIPKILGGPKPTTFQHYLEQPDREKTAKSDLKHYAHNPGDTRIRGHKLYWRQKDIKVNQVEEPSSVSQGDTQHTRMCPVRPGVTFNFRIYFENLSDVELGALAWALTLPGSAEYRHQLGMGKPYGMGVVKLEAALVLINRSGLRYQSLFNGNSWETGSVAAEVADFIASFEKYVTVALGKPNGKFIALDRIKELCVMLTVQLPNPDKFSYMQIEGPNDNEYKDRPVLPYPSELVPAGVSVPPQTEIPAGTLIQATIIDPSVMTVRLPLEYDEREIILPPDTKRQARQPIYLQKINGEHEFRVLSKKEWSELVK